MRQTFTPALLAIFFAGCASQAQFDQLTNDVSPLPQSIDELHGAMDQLHGSVAELQGTTTQLQGNVAQLQGTVAQLQNEVTQLRGTLNTAISGVAKIDLQGVVDDHAVSGNQPPRELYVVPPNKYAEVRVLTLDRSDPKLNFVLLLGSSGYYAYGTIIHNVNQPAPLTLAGMKITGYGTPIVLDTGQAIMCQIVNEPTLQWKLSYHILIYEHLLSGSM